MIQKARFTAEPAAVMVCNPPEGGADIWLRKNVVHESRSAEAGDGTQRTEEEWIADEAYMHSAEAQDEATIQQDFAGWWITASAWQPAMPQPSNEARLSALESAMVDLLMQGGV